ncbi:hypothetical protein [Sunxiuqinia elliptica]|nr:hypothetical protein [Sunxiuqinia elliptica]
MNNEINPEVLEDLKQRWDAMLKIRDSRRTQEEIIDELSSLIKNLSKESFIPYLIQMMIHIDQRNTSEAFKHLMSPMKQFVYLIDLYFSVETNGNIDGFSEEEWMKITLLLNEIEMTYFGDIGFFNENTEEGIDFDRVSVSLKAFLDYFGNAQLSYDEQTLERFETICGAYENDVLDLFGFGVLDAIKFCSHIRKLINKKLNDCNYYLLHQDEWPKLTEEFLKRGLSDPRDWWDEPELKMMKEFRTKPGYVFIHSLADIKQADLPSEKVDKMLDFLLYQEDINKGQTVYYADKNPFFDKPLIKLKEDEFLCPQYKFLIECFYNRINEELAKKKKEKYTQFKNQALEKKASKLFRKLFGKDAMIFESYYFDKAHSEQDLLVVFKGFYFIIEIKDTQFRAPMRDPIKAFDKIKTDFKKSIQYGYDQCKRVENKIEEGKPFKIYDIKTNKCINEINPNRIKDYFSIIITQFKYGGIQTNLEELLKKEEEDLYPWSVCIDDLEAFILALRKIKKGMARTSFVEYLKHREAFHERLVCSDELELCGYFINSPKDFKEQSNAEEIFAAFPGMSDLFDAEYKNGIGFDNELDIDIKKHYSVPKYPKNYDVNKVSGMDFLDDYKKASH